MIRQILTSPLKLAWRIAGGLFKLLWPVAIAVGLTIWNRSLDQHDGAATPLRTASGLAPTAQQAAEVERAVESAVSPIVNGHRFGRTLAVFPLANDATGCATAKLVAALAKAGVFAAPLPRPLLSSVRTSLGVGVDDERRGAADAAIARARVGGAEEVLVGRVVVDRNAVSPNPAVAAELSLYDVNTGGILISGVTAPSPSGASATAGGVELTEGTAVGRPPIIAGSRYGLAWWLLTALALPVVTLPALRSLLGHFDDTVTAVALLCLVGAGALPYAVLRGLEFMPPLSWTAIFSAVTCIATYDVICMAQIRDGLRRLSY